MISFIDFLNEAASTMKVSVDITFDSPADKQAFFNDAKKNNIKVQLKSSKYADYEGILEAPKTKLVPFLEKHGYYEDDYTVLVDNTPITSGVFTIAVDVVFDSNQDKNDFFADAKKMGVKVVLKNDEATISGNKNKVIQFASKHGYSKDEYTVLSESAEFTVSVDVVVDSPSDKKAFIDAGKRLGLDVMLTKSREANVDFEATISGPKVKVLKFLDQQGYEPGMYTVL